jgi:hypothetical protein
MPIVPGVPPILRLRLVLADVVPIPGSIAGFGTGLIARPPTFPCAPLVVAVAWFWCRPLRAAIALAIGLAGAIGMTRRASTRRAAARPEPA